MKGACPGNFPPGKSPGFTLQLWGQSFVWHLFTWHGGVMWSAWSIKACNNKRLSMFVCLHLSQCLNSLPWGKPPRKQHENVLLQKITKSSWQRMAKIFEGKEDLRAQEPKHSSNGDIPICTFPPIFQHPPIPIRLFWCGHSHHFIMKPLHSLSTPCAKRQGFR